MVAREILAGRISATILHRCRGHDDISHAIAMHALNAISQHMQEYAKYAAIAGPTVAEFGGEFLARGGDATQVLVPMDNGRHH